MTHRDLTINKSIEEGSWDPFSGAYVRTVKHYGGSIDRVFDVLYREVPSGSSQSAGCGQAVQKKKVLSKDLPRVKYDRMPGFPDLFKDLLVAGVDFGPRIMPIIVGEPRRATEKSAKGGRVMYTSDKGEPGVYKYAKTYLGIVSNLEITAMLTVTTSEEVGGVTVHPPVSELFTESVYLRQMKSEYLNMGYWYGSACCGVEDERR